VAFNQKSRLAKLAFHLPGNGWQWLFLIAVTKINFLVIKFFEKQIS